jgi:tripartite-type tricarboxylate transporter receptor subunit TctC
MIKMRGTRWTPVAVMLAAALPLLAASPPASAQNAGAFFKGKTVTWIVPYKAGGGYDTYSRMIAPYYSKYTGATVVVENKPGAGGLIGVDLMAASKPNGLTISIINGVGAVSAQIAGEPGAKFDMTKLSYLGRVAGEPKVWVVRSSLKEIQSVKDYLDSKKTYRWGATGPGASEYLEGQVVQGAFGKKLNIITGFDGSVEVAAAMNRGEIDLSSGSVDSRLNALRNGDERPLLVMGLEKNALVPNAPILPDMKNLLSAEGYAIMKAYAGITEASRPVAAPAGVPKDRLEFMREAFKKALTDPALVAQADKIHRPVEWKAGDQVKEDFEDALERSPKVFRDLIKTAYQGSKKKK